jgi:hypothetical protein
MGIAAYNRGTAALRREIDARFPALESLHLDDLTAVSRASATVDVFQATVIRRDDRGWWWIMNNPDHGWASYGYRYKILWKIARKFRLRFVGFGADSESAFIGVEPLPVA